MSELGTGIVKVETMLRMAQVEIDELKTRLQIADAGIAKMADQLRASTLSFCALVVQQGGTAMITPEELEPSYTMNRKQDPATKAWLWTVTKQVPPKLEIVQ
jgi:hypothetical protein